MRDGALEAEQAAGERVQVDGVQVAVEGAVAAARVRPQPPRVDHRRGGQRRRGCGGAGGLLRRGGGWAQGQRSNENPVIIRQGGRGVG